METLGEIKGLGGGKKKTKQTESTSILNDALTAAQPPVLFFSHSLLLVDGHDFLGLSMRRAGGWVLWGEMGDTAKKTRGKRDSLFVSLDRCLSSIQAVMDSQSLASQTFLLGTGSIGF